MLHECSWLQIVLFEIGALFQFIAICTYLREHRASRPLLSATPVDDFHDAPPSTAKPKVSVEQQVAAYRVQRAPATDNTHLTGESAANLLRTAKVHFKQSFKSREA